MVRRDVVSTVCLEKQTRDRVAQIWSFLETGDVPGCVSCVTSCIKRAYAVQGQEAGHHVYACISMPYKRQARCWGASAKTRCDASEPRQRTKEPAESQLRHKVCLQLKNIILGLHFHHSLDSLNGHANKSFVNITVIYRSITIVCFVFIGKTNKQLIFKPTPTLPLHLPTPEFHSKMNRLTPVDTFNFSLDEGTQAKPTELDPQVNTAFT